MNQLMDDILISIIVPAYNIDAYIGRCLDSILKQTHQKIEVIVVNDGSTDKTRDVIEQFAKDDLRIIPIHKENGGVSTARVAGIKRAAGEYIGFVDGDDYVEPDMYAHLLLNALKYHADISHCGYQMVFPNGRIDKYYGTNQILEQDCERGLVDLLIGEQIEPSLCTKLYHRRVVERFEELAIWSEEIRNNEDLLMNYLFFKKANCSIYEDKTFYHYFLRKGSASKNRKSRNKVVDPLKVISLIKNDIINPPELEMIVYQRYLRVLIQVATQKEWIEEAKSAKKQLRYELSKRKIWKKCDSKKVSLMVAVVAYFKPAYMIVRKIYDRWTGVSKKHSLD